MSISDIVDERYRLHVADLEGRPTRAVIVNVTYQGVEELSPVLHLEGFAKRLVLSSTQSQELMRITGTAILSDWVGHQVELRPVAGGGEKRIAIRPIRRRRIDFRPPRRWLRGERGGWLVALLVVLLFFLASMMYIYYNGAALDSVLEQILFSS
jgi:hypothetical protein